MSETPADIDRRRKRTQDSKAAAVDYGVLAFPVAHNAFLARWSMSQDLFEAGLQTASSSDEQRHLVLRAYSLPVDTGQSNFSSIWNDYPIDGLRSSATFTLPTSAARINAVIGVINKSGQFSPILRGHPVPLPAPPPAPPPNKELCPTMKPFQASGHSQPDNHEPR